MNPQVVPLAGLVKLEKEQRFDAQPLDAGSSLRHLMESVTLYETSSTARTRAFEAAHEVVMNYPGFRVATPRHHAWATTKSWAA